MLLSKNANNTGEGKDEAFKNSFGKVKDISASKYFRDIEFQNEFLALNEYKIYFLISL